MAELVPLSRAAITADMGATVSSLWTLGFLLYPLSGLAAWLVWRRIEVGVGKKRAALKCWGWQLLLSSLWPAALYGAHDPSLALIMLISLVLLAVLTLVAFVRVQQVAALVFVPYLGWLLCTGLVAAAAFGGVDYRL